MKLEKKIISFLEEFLKQELEEDITLSIESKLFGGGGPIDSMSLVNLIVELEEYIDDEYSLNITLADEKAMSQRTSPFSRVKNLIEHIKEKIKIEKGE